MTTLFSLSIFFFNDSATTEIYTLSLHDALPILLRGHGDPLSQLTVGREALRLDQDPTLHGPPCQVEEAGDRKSTRLNSSHSSISYAVFCLKKKKDIEHKYRLQSDIDHD